MRIFSVSDLVDELLNDTFTYEYTKSNGDHIVETDDAFEIEVDMPGVSKDTININIEEDYLVITAKRKKSDAKGTVIKYNSKIGEYSKSYKLGSIVDQTNIKAKYEDGVLKVTVAKKQKDKTKKIIIE